MRGGLGGFITGILGLTLLEVIVSSQTATSNFGGAFGGLANLFHHLVDPTIPLIPDLRTKTSSSTPPTAAPGAYVPPSRTPQPTSTPVYQNA